MNPQFKFKISHAVETIEIQEPDGWKEAVLKIDRDPIFHSLIEYFEMPLIFYGSAHAYIRNLEATYGVGYTASLQTFIQFDPDVDFELICESMLDFPSIEEASAGNIPYKAKMAIIREDLWAKFISRKDTPTDIQSTTDLSGNAITPMVAKTLRLPSQKIRYESSYKIKDHFTVGLVEIQSAPSLVQFDFDIVLKDEIKKYNLPRAVFSNDETEFYKIAGLIPAPWDGYYTIDLRLEVGSFYRNGTEQWNLPSDDPDHGDNPIFRIGIAGQPDLSTYKTLTLTRVNNPDSTNVLQVHTYQGQFYLRKSQQLALFARYDNDDGDINGQSVTIFGSRLNNWMPDAKAKTTANHPLSGLADVDSVVIVNNDIILVGDQDDPRENGPYTAHAGAWIRIPQADTSAEIQNAAIKVTLGDTYGGTFWTQNTANVELGVDRIDFVEMSFNETYGVINGVFPNSGYPGVGTPNSYFNITADTIFPNTTTEAFHNHDVGKAIVDRITTPDIFYCPFMGHTSYTSIAYDEIGDAFRYMLMKGLHLKGNSLADKKFFHSFMEWFNNNNAILNLGVGYKTIDGATKIVVDKKEAFYDSSSPSITLYDVKLTRKYDQDCIYKSFNVGYKTAKTDTIAAADDPGKASYANVFERIGKEETQQSDYIAASILVEEARRQSIERTKDYKLDDNTFIIAIKPEEVDDDTFTPELNENFSSISNLINSDTRYNIRLWPVWNFIRWLNVFAIPMDKYLTTFFRFVSGEGNYAAQAEMDPASESLLTNETVISQSQNIAVNIARERGIRLHSHELYEAVNVPLSWNEYKTIIANKEKAIGLSRDENWEFASGEPVQWESGAYLTLAGILFFIKTMSYRIAHASADIVVWPKSGILSNSVESPSGSYGLLLESGGHLKTESNDKILLE
jgi:hypothetical protein